MNFAVVGLAFSHPYTYTQILQRAGHRVTHVWDDDATRSSEFSERFGATPVDSPEAVPTEGIDGVILTARFPERVEHSLLFIERGVPIYSSKPMAATADQLRNLVTAVRGTGTPLMTTSVLRFAPALHALRRHLDQGRLGTLSAAHAISAHRIESYMSEPNIWQDDPLRGGGTIINMGVHALEMLSVLVGPRFRSVWCRAGCRLYPQSLSEDVAVLTVEWEDGLLATVDIVGGVNIENYGVQLYGSSAVLQASIPKGDVQDHRGGAAGDADPWVEYGYVGTMAAFAEMCRTRVMPVPLEESEAIARALLAARVSAASGQPVRIDAVGA